MGPFDAKATQAAYDTVAEAYTAEFADDLQRLPIDRAVLDSAIARFTGDAPVVDVGCGPAQVAGHLAAQGVRVVGVDLSVAMLRNARHRTGLPAFACGDMRSLPFATGSCAGAVAFYSIQHLPRPALGGALAELRRVLEPGGTLVVATHLGEGEVFVQELLGHPIVTVGGTLYRADELEAELEREGFAVDDRRERAPLPHEHQTRRIYLTTRRSAT